MLKREAQRLARQMERDDPRCRVEGLNRWAKGMYVVVATDLRSGTRFSVGDGSDWGERLKATAEARAYLQTM